MRNQPSEVIFMIGWNKLYDIKSNKNIFFSSK